jgi:hypothetical protein
MARDESNINVSDEVITVLKRDGERANEKTTRNTHY